MQLSARNHSIFDEENPYFFSYNWCKKPDNVAVCLKIRFPIYCVASCFLLYLNMFKFGFFLLIATVVTLNLELCFSACARAEYEISGECCPMCAPGNRVYWHCTIDTSTTCVPCQALTYTDEPNGLENCFPCTACGAANGLRVKKTCTRSSDTVCEPLAGFYCIRQNKDSCSFAIEHSKCQPGQYIQEPGTPFTNTECGNCIEGTYSTGLFTTCRPHSNCEKEGRKEKTPGTLSSDVECEDSASVAVSVGTAVGVGVLLTAAGFTTFFILKHKKLQTSETGKTLITKKSNHF
nr:tumor necrosis factor receptor superfamily member 5 [Danio rerio]|eukprot:XP_021334095.1 tumor necrosis factor receptor superfamily member 5 [Danio rerio]